MTENLKRDAGKLRCAPGKDYQYHTDKAVSGLQIKIFPDGSRTWWWQWWWRPSSDVKGKTGRLEIGPYGDGTGETYDYERAAVVATEWNHRKRRGEDPRTYKYKPGGDVTLQKVIDTYLMGDLSPNTKQGVVDHTRKLLAEFGTTTMVNLTPPVLYGFLERNYMGKARTANSIVQKVRAAVNHAKKSTIGLLPPDYHNPASGMISEHDWLKVRGKGTGWKVALEDDEWKRMLGAIRHLKESYVPDGRRDDGIPNRHPIGYLMMEFLVVTGGRKQDAQTLKWEHVKWERQVVEKPDYKNAKRKGVPRTIYLGAYGVQVLQEAKQWAEREKYKGDYVFFSTANRKTTHEYISNPNTYANTIFKLADLPYKTVLHSFRSMYINFALDNKLADLATVAQNVDQDPQTTLNHYITTKLSKLKGGALAVDAALGEMIADSYITPSQLTKAKEQRTKVSKAQVIPFDPSKAARDAAEEAKKKVAG